MQAIYSKIFTTNKNSVKFGTFLGVFLPSLVTMIGSLLYIKLGWILGHVGFFKSISVLSVGLLITLITSLSISATASNMKIKEGGSYYMLSRSFGFEIGASIGLALYIAHTIAICLCILGFSHSISPLLPWISPKTISFLTLASLTGLSLISTTLALRIQLCILFFILTSLVFLLNGSYLGGEIDYVPLSPNLPFWSIFALLFPALTGIEAGCAMSGDLKDPCYSLTRGPILAAVAGFVFYVGMLTLFWVKVPQGYLKVDSQILENILKATPFAMTGLWAATLASALGCLLSAPRTLKAIADDGLFNLCTSIKFCIALTTFFVGLGLYFGSITAVIPLLTIVLLVVYGTLNLATGVEEFINNPSWRPTFRISPYISLFGAFLTFVAMLLMNAGGMFFVSIFLTFLYFIVQKNKKLGNWTDLRESIFFALSRYAIYKLAKTKLSARAWRPNFLILSRSAGDHSTLLSLADQMTHGQGFLTLVSVLKNTVAKVEEIERWENVIRENLKKNHMEALVEVTVADSIPIGLQNIITNYGVGSLAPNTVVLGECVEECRLEDYIKIIKMTLQASRNLLIVRGNISHAKREKEIDIWWDAKNRSNSELMILLADLLVRNKKWQGAKITLKSIVTNSAAFDERTQYFENYLKSARLGIENKVYQVDHSDEIRKTIVNNSTKQGMVFLGLNPPKNQDFGTYYLNMMREVKDISTAAFVICRQKLDLTSIL